MEWSRFCFSSSTYLLSRSRIFGHHFQHFVSVSAIVERRALTGQAFWARRHYSLPADLRASATAKAPATLQNLGWIIVAVELCSATPSFVIVFMCSQRNCVYRDGSFESNPSF